VVSRRPTISEVITQAEETGGVITNWLSPNARLVTWRGPDSLNLAMAFWEWCESLGYETSYPRVQPDQSVRMGFEVGN